MFPGLFRTPAKPPRSCPVCRGRRVVLRPVTPRWWAKCTCGAGPADDEMVRHDPGCDTVPCPFCQLFSESFWQVAQLQRERNRMTDPSSPGRPNHPDFRLMRKIAEDYDAKAVNGEKPRRVIRGAGADPASVLYFAQQRAAFVLNLRVERSFAALAAGTWLDGFLIGLKLAQEQARQVAGGTP